MRSLVIIVSVVSALVVASTAVLYLGTLDAAERILLSRALDRANTMALTVKATAADDGVLDYLSREMSDGTVRFACIYAASGKKLCEHEGPPMDPAYVSRMVARVGDKGRAVHSLDSGATEGGLFELWFPLPAGTGAVKGVAPREFGPGPSGRSATVLLLLLETDTADQLVTRTMVHAIMITLLLAVLLGLTIRQLRLFMWEKTLERELNEQRRFAEIGRLSSVLAHEIRNPLGAIKGFAQYAQEGLAPEDPKREDLETIVTESARLERLVRSLLIYARPREPHPEANNLEVVVANVVHLAERDARARDVEISTKSNLADPEAVFDEEQLTQALLNIVTNGIEAMEGGGRLTVTLAKREGSVCVEVVDDGEGIDPAVLPDIFEPYMTQKASGTGLGLAVARRVARAHGGEIEAENTKGGGACFRIVLPQEERSGE